MSLFDDLNQQVADIFATNWQVNNSYLIPEAEHVKLGNHALKLNATVLYADLAESTNLVDSEDPLFAAEIYKSYLHCASKIIKAEGGAITSFDGDRVMGVFIKEEKNSCAVRCALKINQAVIEVINPAIKAQYNSPYEVEHCVGVDTCELVIARTGVRGSNDLVWIGRAANYAAKLCSIRQNSFSTYITEDVYEDLDDSVKFNNDENMWEEGFWNEKNIAIYCSNWRWAF
jgi:class 3 adenylate cyclase